MEKVEIKKVEFFVKIAIYKGCHVDAVVYYRRRMDINFFLRWSWYFEYIAARIKVAHPRERVELLAGRIDLLTPEAYIEKKRENLIKAKRGQIKKLKNTPDEIDLFDIAINKKQEKIERLEKEIQRLESGEITFWVYKDYVNRINEFIVSPAMVSQSAGKGGPLP